MSEPATFNLWSEPWISLERPNGTIERHGIEYALLHAHEFRGIYEQSPLVVAGIYRLLVAVLQFQLRPDTPPKLEAMWEWTQFPEDEIRKFSAEYADRFDLFSEDKPFMQSANLPLKRNKKDYKPESVAYLAPEIPSGINVTHYRHGGENTDVFCSTCAAGGLTVMPIFTPIGGRTVPASINGKPPIYILPSGESLFHSLRASLITRTFQPGRTVENDLVWWVRTPIVERGKKDVRNVGYLHGLTFTPRMIRLYPVKEDTPCTRCGQKSEWMIREIVYEKGESRAKDEPFWRDPFVAYKPPSEKSKKQGLEAIVPEAGKALWREYAGLFLPLPEAREQGQAHVLWQIAKLDLPDTRRYPFRCIGVRTRQAKFFEWIDEDVEIPLRLLRDSDRGQWVLNALAFAEKCEEKIIAPQFAHTFGRKFKDHERFKTVKARMIDGYWVALAQPFREQLMRGIVNDEWKSVYQRWIYRVRDQAFRQFQQAADDAGKDSTYFATRAKAEAECWNRLLNASNKLLKEVNKA